MAEPVRDIPPERKMMHSIGVGLMGIGLLLFLSGFCVFGWGFVTRDSNLILFTPICAFSGMFLLVIGSIVRGISAQGLAGSGVLLDPQKARKDLEPMNRAAGGMLNDALDEVDVLKSLKSEPAIKVRCRACAALNDEAAKFCNQCGKTV